MSILQRDLALHEPWQKSLERSQRRRELAARARKEVARRKGASAAMATAMLAGPAAPFAAAAQGGSSKRGDDASAPASDAGSGQQIEVRAGGLPLSFGYEGDMVAALQKGVGVESDGIFGPITQNAVKAFQRRAGLPVTGVVDPTTWQALFSGTAAQGTASSSSAPGPVVDLEASKAVERAVPGPKTTPAVNVAAAAKPRLETAEAPAKPKGKAKTKPRSRSVERSEPRRERHSAPKRRTAPKRVKTKPVVDRAPTGGGPCGSRLVKPVKGTQTSGFGQRWGRMHEGVDISAPTGTAIRAAACGVIAFKGQQSGYGNMICIKHTSRFSTCYAHMSRFAGVNGRVRAGQVIGYVGCTGSCTGPHLHFETRVGGSARNPASYLRGARISSQPTVKRASVRRAPVRKATFRTKSTKRSYQATSGSRWSGGSGQTTASTAQGGSGWKQQAPAPAPAPQTSVQPVQPAPAAQPAPVQPKATVTPQTAAPAPAPAAPTPVTPQTTAPQTTAPAPAAPKPAAPAPTAPAPAATEPAPEPKAPVAPKVETPQVEAPKAEAPKPEAPAAPQASKPAAPAAPATQAPEPTATQAPAAKPAAPAPAAPAGPAAPTGPATP